MDQARDLFMQFSGPGGYAVFYFSIVFCCMGFFNSDSCMIAAAILAALGYFRIEMLIPLAFIALLSGDSVTFFVARKWGVALIRKRPFRWILTPEKIQKAEGYLKTQGSKFVFIVRFLPLLRTPLFFTAGSLRVSPKTFYFMNSLSTALYVPTLMTLTYLASENIKPILEELKRYQFVFLIAVALVAFFIFKKSRTEKQKPPPL